MVDVDVKIFDKCEINPQTGKNEPVSKMEKVQTLKGQSDWVKKEFERLERLKLRDFEIQKAHEKASRLFIK
jgi:hypothetical protein